MTNTETLLPPLPSVSHPTDRPNFTSVQVGDLTIYFSYRTPVAFYGPDGLVIRENDWSNTTGKHLNWISEDKSIRISGEDFERKLREVTS